MDGGVDETDGAVELRLAEVVEAGRVAQVEDAAVLEELWQYAVGHFLAGQVLKHGAFADVIEGVKVELAVLETDFLFVLDGVVVAVRTEDDLPVIGAEHRI